MADLCRSKAFGGSSADSLPAGRLSHHRAAPELCTGKDHIYSRYPFSPGGEEKTIIMTKFWISHLVIMVAVFSCKERASQNPSADKVSNNDTSRVRTTIKYAHGFTIDYFDGYKLVRVLDREGGKTDTLEYLLVQRGRPTPAGHPNAQVIPI